MATPPNRYFPCAFLREKGIPSLVWFEDAIAPYGVPTAVFDLYLLVPDIDEAERVLVGSGWVYAGPKPEKSVCHFLEDVVSYRRLNPPAALTAHMEKDDFRGPHPPTTTVLLPAAGWNVAVDELRGSSPDSFVPQLELLLDALIDSLLDSPPSTTLRMHLAVQVAYLYGHCTTLKTQDYAQNLRLDHRQFHYDALSKGGIGTLPFLKEQRQIRDEIRQGVRQPQRNSWYLTPANLEKRKPGQLDTSRLENMNHRLGPVFSRFMASAKEETSDTQDRTEAEV